MIKSISSNCRYKWKLSTNSIKLSVATSLVIVDSYIANARFEFCSHFYLLPSFLHFILHFYSDLHFRFFATLSLLYYWY
jgi:hypothetical protein